MSHQIFDCRPSTTSALSRTPNSVKRRAVRKRPLGVLVGLAALSCSGEPNAVDSAPAGAGRVVTSDAVVTPREPEGEDHRPEGESHGPEGEIPGDVSEEPSVRQQPGAPEEMGIPGEAVSPEQPGPPGPNPKPSCAGELIPARVRKLSDEQYARAVRELLPDLEPIPVVTPGAGQADVEDLDSFGVRGPLAAQYWDAAFSLAERAPLLAMLPCSPAPTEPAAQRSCAEEWAGEFGARAFRRPLREEDLSSLMTVYDIGADSSFEEGLQLIVAAVLQSPHFLYRTELGDPNDAADTVALTPYEIASLLSFSLVGTGPDGELIAAAEAGALTTREEIARQFHRLASSVAGQDHLTRALMRVFGVSKALTTVRDPEQFPDLTATLRQAMADEANHLIRSNLVGQRPLEEVFTTRESLVTPELAELYGLPPVDGPTVVNFTDNKRSGLLTRAATLMSLPAGGSRLVHRGIHVSEQLLCLPIPPPPAAVLSEIEETTMFGLSERELMDQRAQDQRCLGCHAILDAFGVALETYDYDGSFLEERGGSVIDASGTLRLGDTQGDFSGAIELSELMSQSTSLANCAVKHFAEHLVGRHLNSAEQCTLTQVTADWIGGDRTLDAVLSEISVSDLFLKRRKEGESE